MASKVDTPVKAPPAPAPEKTPEPERFYQPERLCPAQRQDGTWRSLPL